MSLHRRTAGLLATAGIAGLVGLGVAYEITRGPAPSIRVRWRDDVGPGRQAALERTYALTNRSAAAADAPRSFSYLLLDTRRRNIEALVRDPEAADTNDIDRRAFAIRPGTASGGEMWIADRLPGLRDTGVRWALILVLAAMVLAGGRVLVVAVARALDAGASWLGSGPRPPLARDPFAVGWKAISAALLVIAVGLPILDTWASLLLAVGVLALVFGVRRRGAWRLAAAAAVVLAVVGLKAILPRADIAEAHNALIVFHDGEALERGLPPEVFRSWRAQFDALYPADPKADSEPFQWREHPDVNVPVALFTPSADAIWRPAKYTRQVDAIGFRTLGEFRGGFANESELDGLRHANRYNFWAGQMARESMPFYVMYELTPASVGSRLAWKGQVFWERAAGRFEDITHPQAAAQAIAPGDAGRRVYAAFFPARDREIYFALEPSITLRLAAVFEALLSIAAVVAMLMLLNRPRRGPWLTALGVFFAGYAVLASHVPAGAEYLGMGYPPHSGGNDGMAHDGWGRMMAMLARHGQIGEALRGAESVYWFTPGMRYFRMVEKLIFGDTNHLYALTLACIPIAMFYLLRHFLGARWALVMTGVFCVSPVGNLSFLQYFVFAQAGYGESVAAGLFLLGLALLLRAQPGWGGTHPDLATFTVAGAALAASMFIRPNFAFAVVWVGAASAWASWRRKQAGAVFALAIGLGLALWMPFHNWYYGRELYLVSKSGATLSVPLGVGDYASAAGDLLRGRVDTHAVAVTAAQLDGWLGGPVFIGSNAAWLARPAHALNLLALALCCAVALRWLTRGAGTPATGVVAVAAICAQVPMLFIFDTSYRYAMLGWDLSLVVLMAWIAERVSPSLLLT